MDEAGFNLRQFFEEHRVQFLCVFLGVFLLGVGALSAVVVSLNRAKPQVEVTSTSEEDASGEDKEIFVDVAGAVEKPGVYRLAFGTRVNDALVAAGGFSADADRGWVSKYINLAQTLSDGIKVYIPKVGEISEEKENASVLSGTVGGSVIGLSQERKVNINAASLSELDSLWGIGDKRAQAIIDNRPYAAVEELLEKRIVPNSVFERIKDEVSVY